VRVLRPDNGVRPLEILIDIMISVDMDKISNPV
jgi:hypothetical protein